jgi:hypothetical protein
MAAFSITYNLRSKVSPSPIAVGCIRVWHDDSGDNKYGHLYLGGSLKQIAWEPETINKKG